MENEKIKEKLNIFADFMGRYLAGSAVAVEYLQSLVETAYNEGYRHGFDNGFEEACKQVFDNWF